MMIIRSASLHFADSNFFVDPPRWLAPGERKVDPRGQSGMQVEPAEFLFFFQGKFIACSLRCQFEFHAKLARREAQHQSNVQARFGLTVCCIAGAAGREKFESNVGTSNH